MSRLNGKLNKLQKAPGAEVLFINSMEASCFSLKCIIVKRIEELVKIVWGSCEYLNQRDMGPPQTLHAKLAAG